MPLLSVLDAAGRRRSPATLPSYHTGRAPRNRGMRSPADPPRSILMRQGKGGDALARA